MEVMDLSFICCYNNIEQHLRFPASLISDKLLESIDPNAVLDVCLLHHSVAGSCSSVQERFLSL